MKFLIFLVNLFSLISAEYSPVICSPTEYKLSLFPNAVHGLWVEQCKECPTCGYPSCCSPSPIEPITDSNDTKFISMYWNQNYPKNETCGIHTVSLFEHEVVKHASCMRYKSTKYLHLVEPLFYKYRDLCNQSKKLECVFDVLD